MRLFKKAGQPGSQVGLPVFTSDDHHIGDVKEVEDGAIRIDAPMGKDYWLSERDVQSTTEERVMVNFMEDELDDYKREERPPDSVPEGIPYTRAGLVTDEEQMHMREQVEREMEEQRQRLHDN
jgi:hypothetical protein